LTRSGIAPAPSCLGIGWLAEGIAASHGRQDRLGNSIVYLKAKHFLTVLPTGAIVQLDAGEALDTLLRSKILVSAT
jgi:hypothetical protein